MLLQALRNIGFTQQEAVIYIQLCKNGELTGYEAAKLSGISRSNAYAALSNLVDKGYAHIIEGTSMKYVAVSKEELIANVDRAFKSNISIIDSQLIFNQVSQEPYITISGEKSILNKVINIIAGSKKRIYLSCPDDMLPLVAEYLIAAIERGLKVVVLSPTNALAAQLLVHYTTDENNSFKLIADTEAVVAGTFKQCLYSKNPTLLSLIRESFINEIAVIESKNKSKSI